MTLFVRKVNKAKWLIEQLDSTGEWHVNADAITNCLKTTKNTLSFWVVDDIAQLNEAILAIAASNDNLDAIDVVVLPEAYLRDNGFDIQRTDGATPCADLVDTHRDLANLNIRHLDVLSSYIVNELKNKTVKRYTLSDLRAIVKKAIEDGRVSPEMLKDGVRKKVVTETPASA